MPLEDYLLPCPIKKSFGIDCFGCGSQRAILMIFEGKFSEAWQLFPASYTLVIFFTVILLNFIDKKRNYSLLIIGLAILNVIIMIVSYFIRHPNLFKL